MKIKVLPIFLIITMCLLTLTGCGSKTPEATSDDTSISIESENSEDENAVIDNSDTSISDTESTDTENNSDDNDELNDTSIQHRHYFVYTPNQDGTHTKTCSDEACDFYEIEACTFTENNNCARCDYVHNHPYIITYIGDNTHKYSCPTPWCLKEYTESCDLDERGVCKKCKNTHTHDFLITELTKNNFYEVCQNESCKVQNYLWTIEPVTFTVNEEKTNLDPTDYFLMSDCNILSEPNEQTATIKESKEKDDVVKITGQVNKYRNQPVHYYVTEDRCYVNDNVPGGIISLAKSNETLVHQAPDSSTGIIWENPKTFYKSYKSKDAAILDITGVSVAEITSKGTSRTDYYNNLYYDYESITLILDKSFLSCDKGIFYLK